MTFWKKFRLVGSLLALVVAALTVCAALLLRPDSGPVAPEPVASPPSPWNNGPGSNGL